MADQKENDILNEIRDAEAEAEEILSKAQAKKESIIKNAQKEADEMLQRKIGEIKKAQDKKLSDFRAKSGSASKDKIEEGKKQAKQLQSKAEKNLDKAADFAIKKVEGMI